MVVCLPISAFFLGEISQCGNPPKNKNKNSFAKCTKGGFLGVGGNAENSPYFEEK